MSFDHHSSAKHGAAHVARLAFGLAAAGLIGAVALGVGGVAGEDGSEVAVPNLPPPTPIAAQASGGGNIALASTADILARPLFSSSRRPSAKVAGPAADPAKPMPRLTGVVVSPVGRFALFANADGGRPLVMREGDHFGAAVIEAIVAGEVTVRGPDGAVVLRSTFDENAVTAKPAMPIVPPTPRPPMPFRTSSRAARTN